jgi:hypothetical protein
MVPTRRQTLTTIGLAVSVTGCLGFGEPDLVVENELEQSVTADVDITRMSDMREVVRTDRSIASGTTTDFMHVFDESSEYRIQITAREANAGGEKTVHASDDSSTIRASLVPDGVRFTETS